MERDSVLGTLVVATVLCVVCSVLVSAAAVFLNPIQEVNKELYKKKNILFAAGLADKGVTAPQVEEIYKERVKEVLVDLDEGRIVPRSEQAYEEFDPREAADNPATSKVITFDGPTPGVDRRENWAFVYEVLAEGSDETVEQIVLPIYGKGLWSTLYGFLAIDADGETIRGITFYDHGETPGLGGEVENPKWQSQWEGKLAYDDQGNVAIEVIKGTVDPQGNRARFQVDGLSGATITSNGVEDFVQYWLGPDGFGPFLKKQTE